MEVLLYSLLATVQGRLLLELMVMAVLAEHIIHTALPTVAEVMAALEAQVGTIITVVVAEVPVATGE